jgi:uncharacterized protein (TIGR00288 family)
MPQIAVFIDGDNASCKYLKVIINEIREHGNIVLSRVYADWSCANSKPWLEEASVNGITTVQCDRIAGKNSTDIKLMVDMMIMLYEEPNIDLFFIVTSDSDYRHVVEKIKLKGRKCHCIGTEQTNKCLQNICDKFIKMENLCGEKKLKKLTDKQYTSYLNDIKRLLEEKDSICMSAIKQAWVSKYKFDCREYGHERFMSFLFHTYGSKLKKKSSDKGTVMVSLKGV